MIPCDAPLPLRHGKRWFDIAVSALLLLALAPVYLAIMAAMLISYACRPQDRGPLIYREPRISRGRLFTIRKFRTVKQPCIDAARAAGGGRLKTVKELEQKADNLTWSGRFLRDFYVDELPQLWNVLIGDMSLVGPRPWPEEDYLKQRSQGYNAKGAIPCGLTGLVQCHKRQGKNDLLLDLEYIEQYRTRSTPALLAYDLGIVLRSLRTMWEGKGI
jgi:lipopolysaccharide/colanic/teichoic acid biosynthesis glycosyltransferase